MERHNDGVRKLRPIVRDATVGSYLKIGVGFAKTREANGDSKIFWGVFLWCGSSGGLRRTGSDGLLSLPIMPFVVRWTNQCLHPLEARCREDHGRGRACWHVSEDACECAAILQEVRRPFDDQSSSVGTGGRILGHIAYAKIRPRRPRELCRDCTTHERWSPEV